MRDIVIILWLNSELCFRVVIILVSRLKVLVKSMVVRDSFRVVGNRVRNLC